MSLAKPAAAERGPRAFTDATAQPLDSREQSRPVPNYRPLLPNDLERIHEAALVLLETVGFANPIPSCVEALTGAGAIYGEDGRIRFPRRLVLETVAGAARHFTLHGQHPRHDMAIQGGRVHYGTAGLAVHLVDAEKRSYRESALNDIYDAARIVEGLDNIHFFQRPMVARDLADPLELDLNTLYACVSGTSKHIGTSFTVRENVKPALDMLHMIAGGEAAFRARPFISSSSPFVVSPMKFAEDACGVLEECVKGGIPILLLSTGQAGATAPAALAGAVVQAVAEVLAGLAYVNALKRGHPAMFGTWPFASDLRTGQMSGGSAEQALLTAACAQMAQFYDLPGASAAGMADSKLPDIQSGYEKGITNVMAGLSGLDLVYEAAGMHASLLGFCLESLIIDNDMLGYCQRCARGIDTGDAALSVEAITDVCLKGPGHYLNRGAPAGEGRPDASYPMIGDTLTPKEWCDKGRPDMLQKAIAEKKRILAERFPRHIVKSLDDRLRARFGELIRLPRGAMGWKP
ncbi:MAG TPA: trimethylamine methyltransferase family protein [Mesorhizobium sp.]